MKFFHTRLFVLLLSVMIWLTFGIFMASPLPTTHWSNLLVLFSMLLGGIVSTLFYFGLELRYQKGKISQAMLSIGLIAFFVILTFAMIIPHPRNDIKIMLAILFFASGILMGLFYVLSRSKQCINILKKEKLGIIRLDNGRAFKAAIGDVVAGFFGILIGAFFLYKILTSKTFAAVLNAYGIFL